MPSITGSNTGGTDITSYALFWNQGSGVNFVEVVGYTTDNLIQSATKNGLTNGGSYDFYYMVKNIYGWSTPSPTVTIYSAKAPDAPLAPTTSIVPGSML